MGVSDIEGKAPKAFGASEWSGGDAGDIDGKTERSKCPGGHESMWATERVSNQEPMKKPIVAQIISFCATRRLRYYDGQSARRLYL